MPDPSANPELVLPPGYAQRPLRLEDAGAVAAVMQAGELADVGHQHITEADIAGDWRRPSFDLAASSVGVFAEGVLVAYGEVSTDVRCDAAVHPDHRGRGLGTAIASWIRTVAEARGMAVVGMQVPEGSTADGLLAALGWTRRWTAWDLKLPDGATLAAAAVPKGYAVRAARPTERRAAHAVIEDAFLEWSQRERIRYDDWEARFLGRDGIADWNLRVATDPAGEVVGAAVVTPFEASAYVEQLATRADRRGRGLGGALLADALAAAAEHGATTLELSTDSRSGALGLYERAGLQVISTWVQRALTLSG